MQRMVVHARKQAYVYLGSVGRSEAATPFTYYSNTYSV